MSSKTNNNLDYIKDEDLPDLWMSTTQLPLLKYVTEDTQKNCEFKLSTGKYFLVLEGFKCLIHSIFL